MQFEGADGIGIVGRGEYHRGRRQQLLQMLRQFDAVHAGHAYIKQRHINAARSGDFQGLAAIARLPCHRHRQRTVDVGQQVAHAAARRRLIIGNQYPQRRGAHDRSALT